MLDFTFSINTEIEGAFCCNCSNSLQSLVKKKKKKKVETFINCERNMQ